MAAKVVRLAVLGDPLTFTRSPELHRAGVAALGMTCESEAIRTPPDALSQTLANLAAAGAFGCNLTIPLKELALECVREATPRARRARSVNTITFGPGGAVGDTTDGIGFVDLLASLDRDAARDSVVLLGSGGAARSLALALLEAESPGVSIISRQPPEPEGLLNRCAWSAWGSAEAGERIAAARVVVNCTPLGVDDLPRPAGRMAKGALAVDLTYRETLTPWIAAARAQGFDAVDGLGLLVHQARHSLRRWFGRDVPLAVLGAAVGWPR